jgi:hypothetical protein
MRLLQAGRHCAVFKSRGERAAKIVFLPLRYFSAKFYGEKEFSQFKPVPRRRTEGELRAHRGRALRRTGAYLGSRDVR